MGDSTKRYDLDGFEQTAFLTSYKEPKSSTTCCGYTIEKKRLRGRNRILLLNKCLATFHTGYLTTDSPF